ATDLAAWPHEVVGTAGGWRKWLALHQRARGERIDRGRARARPAKQLIGLDGERDQWHDRSGQRPRRRLTGHRTSVRGCRLARQRDRRRTRQEARDLALDIVRELARAGLGEEDTVIGAQLADLAF